MTREELQVLADAAYNGALVATKPLLNVNEAADFLGVSREWIYKLIERGKLRVKRIEEKKIVIDRHDLLQLPKGGPKP